MKLIMESWKKFLREDEQASDEELQKACDEGDEQACKELEKRKIMRMMSMGGDDKDQGTFLASILLPEEYLKAENYTLKYWKELMGEILDNRQAAKELQKTANGMELVGGLLEALDSVKTTDDFLEWGKDYLRIAGELMNDGMSHWVMPLTWFPMTEQKHMEEEEFDFEAIIGPENLYTNHYVAWFLDKIFKGHLNLDTLKGIYAANKEETI